MEYELRIYDKLLQFTLFQGMSRAELMEVVAHTKLDFQKLPAGRWVTRADDECTHVTLLVSGMLQCETASADGNCRVVEMMEAPYMLPLNHLFGLTRRHVSSFKTLTPCHLITIDKQEVLLLLETQLVFRLNMLNLLAAESQTLQRRVWHAVPHDLRQRIVRFFFSHTLHPAGPKTFFLLMRQLAAHLNDSRLDVSRELNAMQAEGLLTLHRGRIVIPLLERLLM